MQLSGHYCRFSRPFYRNITRHRQYRSRSCYRFNVQQHKCFSSVAKKPNEFQSDAELESESESDLTPLAFDSVFKSVLKIHCTRSIADRTQQWQNVGQRHSTGSGFLISDQRILTNAHVCADHSFITVSKHNSGTQYPARVVAIGHECDIAMLQIMDEYKHEFFHNDNEHDMDDNENDQMIRDSEYCDTADADTDTSMADENTAQTDITNANTSAAESDGLEFGGIPELQETVTVLGYPTGGETISVTRGVVSRVEVINYIHAAHSLLGIQIDAAINSGNSGGPALINNKVIGIAFQNMSDAENVGYIIPVPVIEHFLGDIERFGDYKGFCSLGIAFQVLPDTRMIHSFFKMPSASAANSNSNSNSNSVNSNSDADAVVVKNSSQSHKQQSQQSGILVTKVYEKAPAENVLQMHDIITNIDGYDINNDGTINGKFLDHGTNIAMEHLIACKYDGDRIDLCVWRDAHPMRVSTTLQVLQYMVPIHQYNESSDFYIFGGCVFIALTQPYLQSFGDEWYFHAPRQLMNEAMKPKLAHSRNRNDIPVKELLMMSSVRPHEINMGCKYNCNMILEKISDIHITSLVHLKQVIEEKVVASVKSNSQTPNDTKDTENNSNGDGVGDGDNTHKLIDFHFLENRLMVLDCKQSLMAEDTILHRNRIPYRQSTNLDVYDNPEFQALFAANDTHGKPV